MCQHCVLRWWVMISMYRKRHEDLDNFFKMKKGALLLAMILMAWCKHSVLITILWAGDSLQTRLSWVSKQFSFTVAKPYLPFLLVIQSIIRSRMRTWTFWGTPLIRINQMANLWWPKTDCLTTWTTTRIHKILLLRLWMGQQSSVSSLLKKGLACQKISGTRNHECGKSATSGTE